MLEGGGNGAFSRGNVNSAIVLLTLLLLTHSPLFPFSAPEVSEVMRMSCSEGQRND